MSLELENRKYLAGMVIVAVESCLIYWLAFVNPANLFKLYLVPHLDGAYLRPGQVDTLVMLVLSFAGLAVLYLAGWWLARQATGKMAWGILIAGTFAFSAILLAMAPFDADDIYDNISHARTLAIYHGNPFIQVPNDYPSDPFTPFVAWAASPSAYGPLWELLASRVAFIAGDGIVQNVFAFKILPGMFLLGSIAIVAALLRQKAPKYALSGTLLLAWNPVVLYETWGNGHNDMAMVFWILAAIWAITNRAFTLSILALITGALIKYIPLLLLPAAGLIALREIEGKWPRVRFLILTGILALVMVGLAYAPFWDGLKTLTLNRREHMFTATVPAILFYASKFRIGDNQAALIISRGAFVLTALFSLWQGYQAMRNRVWDSFARAASLTLAFYLLVTCLWFQNWYTLWLIGLAPLVYNRYARSLAILFGFTALTKTLVIGPYLFWPVKRLPQPWFEFWLTVGVLGIPWLYALLALWRSRRRIERLRLDNREKVVFAPDQDR